MTVGTKSLLFGVHQVLWHPLTVLLAWRSLYGWPTWREAVCIFVHDWGYWGCPEMDGSIGRRHPARGAAIAGRLLGSGYRDLVMWHSSHLADAEGHEPSKLCWADKFSMLYDPQWFYLLRARLSGEIREYRVNAARANFIPLGVPDAVWHKALTIRLARLAKAEAAQFQ